MVMMNCFMANYICNELSVRQSRLALLIPIEVHGYFIEYENKLEE